MYGVGSVGSGGGGSGGNILGQLMSGAGRVHMAVLRPLPSTPCSQGKQQIWILFSSQ